MEAAPFNKPVIVRTAGGKEFLARLVGVFIDSRGRIVNNWSEEYDNTAPKCWTDGICWEQNADGVQSDPPILWRHPKKSEVKPCPSI